MSKQKITSYRRKATKYKVIAVDISENGGDESCIIIRKGNKIIKKYWARADSWWERYKFHKLLKRAIKQNYKQCEVEDDNS